ncbi:unnamed protein product [Amoebophrya sp. A25]|nr:unnamed protein product [Amoebophrya sp. A25]|eukprot:GSA25T00006898001.1
MSPVLEGTRKRKATTRVDGSGKKKLKKEKISVKEIDAQEKKDVVETVKPVASSSDKHAVKAPSEKKKKNKLLSQSKSAACCPAVCEESRTPTTGTTTGTSSLPQEDAKTTTASTSPAQEEEPKKKVLQQGDDSSSEEPEDDSSSEDEKENIDMKQASAADQSGDEDYPYPVDDGDHFETSEEAYGDLKAILDFHVKLTHNATTGQQQKEVVAYDPYFCTGNAKVLLEKVMQNVGQKGDEKCSGKKHINKSSKKKAGAKHDEEELLDEEDLDEDPALDEEEEEELDEDGDHEQAAVAATKSSLFRVINEKRDFYADIEKNVIPDYDLLVTNPPYSGDHKQRLLVYLLADLKKRVASQQEKLKKELEDLKELEKIEEGGQASSTVVDAKTRKKIVKKLKNQVLSTARPFCMLIPSWTCQKSFFRKWLWEIGNVLEEVRGTTTAAAPATSSSCSLSSKKFEDSPDLERRAEVFYIAPWGYNRKKYEFIHTKANQKSGAAPFFGVWVCGGFRNYHGFDTKFGGKKITLDLQGLVKMGLCRSNEDVKKRRELNEKQKWRAETYGKKGAGKKGKKGEGKTNQHGGKKGDHKGGKDATSKGLKGKISNSSKGAKDLPVKKHSASISESKADHVVAETTKVENKVRPSKSDVKEAASSTGTVASSSNEQQKGDSSTTPAAPKKKIICRHFNSEKGCSRGDKCRFEHVKE